MSRENFYSILELSPKENNKEIITKAIKKKQAEWSKLRNHPSKGRIAQKNLSLLKEIKKVMLDDNLRAKEAQALLKETLKDERKLEEELKKQIELLSSKGKIYKSELENLKEKFPEFKNIENKIKVKIVNDTSNGNTIKPAININKNFLPTLETSTLKKIDASLKILNKRDLYHFLGVTPSTSPKDIKAVTEKKYLQNNKSASKTAEVTSTSELLGMVKSILLNGSRKKLYDNHILLKKLKKLDDLMEISGKNGIIEKEEYLFIYEEGKLNNIDEETIKKYIDFFAKNKNIKLEIPDFSKAVKFRNPQNNEEQLFDLIRKNEPRDIEELLKNNYSNININKKNKHGSTPLILATYLGHLKIVKILVENGADVNLPNNDKTTPLIWATVGEHTTIVRYLLNNNADINAQDKHGFTALMWAASKNNETLVKIFLQYNANTQLKNNNSETAYELAKKAGNIRLFYIIKDHKGADKANLKKNILKAIENNDLIFLSKQYGINFNDITDDNGNNILHLSIRKRNRDIIDWILTNKKINVNSQNTLGNTPLIEAVINNDDVTVSSLLKDRSIDINKQDNNGYTALFHAVNTGNEYLVKTLLLHNAKMEIEDKNGNRALTIAVWQDKRNIAKILIDNGAKTDIKTQSGKTLIDLAKERNNQSMVEFLSIYIESPHMAPQKKDNTHVTAIETQSIASEQGIDEQGIDEQGIVSEQSIASEQGKMDKKEKKEKKKEKKPWWKFW